MNTAMINGGPKLNKSNSGFISDALQPLLTKSREITRYNVGGKPLTDAQYSELRRADALVLLRFRFTRTRYPPIYCVFSLSRGLF